MTKGERKIGGGSDLYTDQTLRDYTMKIGGKEYPFKYRLVPHFVKKDILGECLNAETKTVRLGLYYRRMLARMIVEHPFDEALELALAKLGDEAGEELCKIVPAAVEVTQEQADFTGAPSEAQ